MADEDVGALRSIYVDAELQVRDVAKRELDMRLVPWNTVIDTIEGPEEFRAGAFDHISPDRVYLYPPGHAAGIGIGQDGRPVINRTPAGRAITLDNRTDGEYATVRSARTQAGDEILALAQDGIVTGVSIEFREVRGGTTMENRNGRRVRVHTRADLNGVSTTHRPAYGEQAAVLAVRSQEEEIAPVTEATEAPVAGAIPDPVDLSPVLTRMDAMQSGMNDRFAALEDHARANIIIPTAPKVEPPSAGVWMQHVLRMLSGERIAESQMREVAELVTTDNIGVVPPAYLTEIIGVINRRRPFMETTRHLATPASGMRMVVPRIVTRPTVAQQIAEKDELSSTKTEIDTVDFPAVTKGGVGDISLQLLKRSDPSFLELYLSLLAEAYAAEAEVEAVEALLGLGSGGFGSGGFGNGGVNDGGTMDPNDGPSFGAAWQNGYNVMFGGPDTIWLSSAAVAAYIDAKADTTNQPLYGNLQANFSAAGGVGGNISGLRPVHVPALNNTGVDILVGPSNGFAWAEDGTYTLQVDVPAKAGRDVAIVGMLWFAPLYPTAFTGWELAGS